MRLRTVVLLMAALFPPLGVLSAQQPGITSESFRKGYLEKFPWTMANTTAGDAMMLRVLVESHGARNGVEVGTNTGYGAINMGIGFERTGGHLTTIEISRRTAAAARDHLAKVGLDKVVTVVEGDALKVLPTLRGDVRLRVPRCLEAGLPEVPEGARAEDEAGRRASLPTT